MVSKHILQMLNEGKMEEGLNKTLITLIPKVKDPERIEDYRPISLCNVGAKIVTKILANRLKLILPAIISENQSAFVPVSYVIRINDWVTGEIKPGRGIRQGDPLSPFLFLICTEWLSIKVSEYQRRQKLNGVKICRGAPEITHLLFADDSIFFLRANVKNAENLRRILAEYEILSGQKVNLSKSEIFFGGNVTVDDRRRICETPGVREFIVERIWKKVQGWKEKSLSTAGKETLIQAVVQSMPTYAMSCFKIPEKLIKRIVSIVSNYWWSNSKVGRGIYWCKYEKLCEEKLDGGLGFRYLSIFNDALLSKQVWRLMKCPESLVGRLLKMRYYKETTPINCQLGSRPSFVWRSIWTAGQKIKQWIDLSSTDMRPRWMLGENGDFAVRSVYKGLKLLKDQLRRNQVGEQADSWKMKVFWKIIWRMNVQPKNLGIDCSFLNHDFTAPGDWLWFCVFKYDALELSMILQGARHIWFNRNMVLNGNKGQDPLVAARYVFKSRWQAHHSHQQLVVTDLNEGRKWIRPGKGVVKINVDGAWDHATKAAGLGFYCRDEHGAFCFVEADYINGVTTSFDVELRALARAMEAAEEEKFCSVIFETDCAQVMKAVMQGPRVGFHEPELIQWCRKRLEDNMLWSVNLVLREANMHADLLAKKALQESWSWRSHSAIPVCLSSVTNSDIR
ncbi:hypothetical protein QQ045_014771 [Rhodiola kirilowii]